MTTVLSLLFVACSIAALTFIVRLGCALFSRKISDEMRRHPVAHWIWGGLAFVGVLLFLGVPPPAVWPPAFVERREQRQKVLERVAAAGGWEAIRRDCMNLAEQQTNGSYFNWYDTNLPAILALQPLTVRYLPSPGRVSIRIFGIHSTGGHSTPYFGLEVLTEKKDGYKPGDGHAGGRIANQVADGIYEIY